jgi:hypothetical protein
MGRVLTVLCLVVLALTFLACGTRVGPPPAPGPGGAGPTLEVTAAHLAQDFTDDYDANSRYANRSASWPQRLADLAGLDGFCKRELSPRSVARLCPTGFTGPRPDAWCSGRTRVPTRCS